MRKLSNREICEEKDGLREKASKVDEKSSRIVGFIGKEGRNFDGK